MYTVWCGETLFGIALSMLTHLLPNASGSTTCCRVNYRPIGCVQAAIGMFAGNTQQHQSMSAACGPLLIR
jgi:hypothetical protein